MKNRKIKAGNKELYTIGKPITFTYNKMLEVLKNLVNYIENEDYPTMSDFCVKYKIYKQRIYEWSKNENINKDCKAKYPLCEYFADCIKRMNDKQETFIEHNGIKNNIPIAFAIFKLKQLGWKDRIEETVNENEDLIKAIKERNQMIKDAIKNDEL